MSCTVELYSDSIARNNLVLYLRGSSLRLILTETDVMSEVDDIYSTVIAKILSSNAVYCTIILNARCKM